MFLAVFVAVLIVAAAAGVYVFVLASTSNDVAQWVSGSYDALRNSELDVASFDVHVRDTRIGDVFASFPQDEGAVITAQSLAGEWDNLKIDRSQPRFRHRATHSFVG